MVLPRQCHNNISTVEEEDEGIGGGGGCVLPFQKWVILQNSAMGHCLTDCDGRSSEAIKGDGSEILISKAPPRHLRN